MSGEGSKTKFEEGEMKRKLEVKVNDECSSNIIGAITITSQRQTCFGAKELIDGDTPGIEGLCQSTERGDQSGNLNALAKVHEEIDSTWSHLHKMWTELGHDAKTVEILKNRFCDGIKECIGTARKDTFRERYYNGNGVRIHPLLVDNIVSQIFKHAVMNCSGDSARTGDVSSTIRNCRLVCKTWNERATDLVHKTGPQIILAKYSTSLRDREIYLENLEDVKGFVEAMKESTLIPFLQYYIYGEIFEPENGLLLEELLSVIGSSATDISVSLDEEDHKHCLDKSWGENLELPKLKKFNLDCLCFDGSSVDGKSGVTRFIKRILTSAQNLRELSIFLENEHREVLSEEPIQTILKLIPATVKVLRLDLPFLSDLHVQALAIVNLELNELTFSCDEINCSSNSIGNFFGKQIHSLTYFSCNEEISKVLSSEFPQLEKLAHLDVTIGQGTTINFSFHHKFPAVKKLEIEINDENDFHPDLETMLEETKKSPLVSLEDLTLDSFFLTNEQVKTAKQCFPNVKILKVWLGPHDSKLESVFMHFNQIEELNLSFVHNAITNGDALLAGVPVDICKALLQKENFRDVDIQKFQTKYSLLNLTKLKKLHISNVHGTAVFSDLSCHHILLRLPNLEELQIEKSNVSFEYEELLRGKLKKCKLGD